MSLAATGGCCGCCCGLRTCVGGGGGRLRTCLPRKTAWILAADAASSSSSTSSACGGGGGGGGAIPATRRLATRPRNTAWILAADAASASASRGGGGGGCSAATRLRAALPRSTAWILVAAAAVSSSEGPSGCALITRSVGTRFNLTPSLGPDFDARRTPGGSERCDGADGSDTCDGGRGIPAPGWATALGPASSPSAGCDTTPSASHTQQVTSGSRQLQPAPCTAITYLGWWCGRWWWWWLPKASHTTTVPPTTEDRLNFGRRSLVRHSANSLLCTRVHGLRPCTVDTPQRQPHTTRETTATGQRERTASPTHRGGRALIS